jgi:hypothetical protein
MSDPYKQTVADERGQIVLKEPQEVEYWTQHLGVSEQYLRAVIAAFGNAAHDVRKYLAEHRPT